MSGFGLMNEAAKMRDVIEQWHHASSALMLHGSRRFSALTSYTSAWFRGPRGLEPNHGALNYASFSTIWQERFTFF